MARSHLVQDSRIVVCVVVSSQETDVQHSRLVIILC